LRKETEIERWKEIDHTEESESKNEEGEKIIHHHPLLWRSSSKLFIMVGDCIYCVCIHITELNKLVLKLEKRAPDVGLVRIDAEEPPPNDAPKWTIKSIWDAQRRFLLVHLHYNGLCLGLQNPMMKSPLKNLNPTLNNVPLKNSVLKNLVRNQVKQRNKS